MCLCQKIRAVRALLFCVSLVSLALSVVAQNATDPAGGKTRVYYIAADEIEWDYAPTGIDEVTGKPIAGYRKTFVEHNATSIGSVYKKAIYREYTDATFTQLKPRPADQQYLGFVGPIIQAEVGDTLSIVFKNNGSHPYSLHPHGVFYDKDSEGSPYDDGTSGADKSDDAVPPGGMHTYTWPVPERAGPLPGQPSSVFWLYHSHTHEMRDVDSGLIGGIIVTRRGMARPDGSPKDVDRQLVTIFFIDDENDSWFMDDNIKQHIADPGKINRGEFYFADKHHPYESIAGQGFVTANLKATINGYLFGDGPMMTMKKGERVRWYIGSIGDGFNFHTPHWHGNTAVVDGRRVDVVGVMPLQTLVADMVPDNPGIWLYHCHVDDHMNAGMLARFQVLP